MIADPIVFNGPLSKLNKPIAECSRLGKPTLFCISNIANGQLMNLSLVDIKESVGRASSPKFHFVISKGPIGVFFVSDIESLDKEKDGFSNFHINKWPDYFEWLLFHPEYLK